MSGKPNNDQGHKGSFGDLPPLIIDSSVKGSAGAHTSAEAFAHAPNTPTCSKQQVGGTERARSRAGDAWARIRRHRTAEERKWLKRVGVVALASMVMIGGTWGIYALIPRPIPDYAEAPMDEVLDYTLLSEDFNKLPIEKRLELIKDLIQRIKTMSADDSSMMAMFAAGIKDQMRKQMEENAKRLAVDMMDKYAREYEGVPPEEAEKFMDDTIDEFTRTMEDIGGQKSGLPEDPAERLAALKRQAKRDQERAREDGANRMNTRQMAGLIEFMHRDAGDVAGPAERSRVTKFVRDVTRHLRDQDISTGKPKNPGGGGG